MEGLEPVLYYSSNLWGTSQDNSLTATLGYVLEDDGDIVTVSSPDGSIVISIEKELTRPARKVKFFEFWKAPGFYSTTWSHAVIWVFFLLFIY